MSLPDAIASYLTRWALGRYKPYCMSLAPDNSLLESWGNPGDFGFDAMDVGTDVSEWLPLLADYSEQEEIELPFVTDARGNSYHVHLFREGGSRYVLLINADAELVERQRYQQTANEVRLALEREQRLMKDLVDAQTELVVRRVEAEEESRRRGEYIATMSHEFRTPMSAIVAHAERLAEQATADSASDIGKAIARVAHRQIWVIDNLLSRAKLDADGFTIHNSLTDIRRLVDELSLVFAPLAAEKTLSFVATVAHSVPEFVWVDSLHLRQVLVNLLGNAIKYTTDGAVELRLEFGEGRIHACVSDTGPGMDEESQKTVFARFVRGREAPASPGAGLGLGISRQLVDAMGGELNIESAKGTGTTVRLEIPTRDPSGDSIVAQAQERLSIIVCDDDPDITDLLDFRLTEAGHDVNVASDGDDLITKVLEADADLVIVDLNMPRIDGPSAARRLRESGYRGPILVLSGAARRRDIEYALASGCTEYIRKPPQIAALTRTIQRLALAAKEEDSGRPLASKESKQM